MSFIRTMIVNGVLALVAATAAQAQQRPPIGLYGSPPDAMIFYVAHGAAGACGPGCSDWIAAEGTVQWDSYKRLIAILDRQAGHKLPLVIAVRDRAVRAASAPASPRSSRRPTCRDRAARNHR